MGILAGIDLVYKEGAEPAALSVPRVPPAGQWVSVGVLPTPPRCRKHWQLCPGGQTGTKCRWFPQAAASIVCLGGVIQFISGGLDHSSPWPSFVGGMWGKQRPQFPPSQAGEGCGFLPCTSFPISEGSPQPRGLLQLVVTLSTVGQTRCPTAPVQPRR